jgi:hypothetical protein
MNSVVDVLVNVIITDAEKNTLSAGIFIYSHGIYGRTRKKFEWFFVVSVFFLAFRSHNIRHHQFEKAPGPVNA